MTVNDPFVCQAWAKEHKAEGKVRQHVRAMKFNVNDYFFQVRVLADPDAKFTKVYS